MLLKRYFKLGEIDLSLSLLFSLIILVGITAAQFALQKSNDTRSHAASACLTAASGIRTVISTPDTAYSLCAPNDYSAGIDVNADRVTIDGGTNRFTIDGKNNPVSGIKINGKNNVAVTNIIVKGFKFGMESAGGSNITVSNSEFSSNTAGGLNPDWLSDNNTISDPNTGGGIYFEGVSSSKIINAQTHGNIAGVTLSGSNNIEISNGDFSGNSGWGVRLLKTSNSNIHDNQANGNNRFNSKCPGGGCESAGILLTDGSSGNQISGNSLNNSGDGFYILGDGHVPSNNNIITGNTAASTDGKSTSGNGFEATFSNGNDFEKNTTSGKNYGFWLGFSEKTIVNGNTAAAIHTGISIPASKCNAIINNIINSNDTSENNGIFPNNSDLNGKSSACSDNYVNNNTPALATAGCTNTQNIPIPSCNLPLNTPSAAPSPTTGISPTPNPNLSSTPPPPGASPTSAPPNPTRNPSLNRSGSVTIEVHRDSSAGPFWSATNPFTAGYASPNNLIVYLTGPDNSPSGFGERLIIPGNQTGNPDCTGSACRCRSATGFVYECEVGSITWKGAYTNPGGLPAGNAGTALGAYTASINQAPPGFTGGQPSQGSLTQAGSNLKLILVVNQGSSTPLPSPSPAPTASIAPTSPPSSTSGYTNRDYEIIITQYGSEQLSALTVSAWLSLATRVPGLQTATCYPPNCDFAQ